MKSCPCLRDRSGECASRSGCGDGGEDVGLGNVPSAAIRIISVKIISGMYINHFCSWGYAEEGREQLRAPAFPPSAKGGTTALSSSVAIAFQGPFHPNEPFPRRKIPHIDT